MSHPNTIATFRRQSGIPVIASWFIEPSNVTERASGDQRNESFDDAIFVAVPPPQSKKLTSLEPHYLIASFFCFRELR